MFTVGVVGVLMRRNPLIIFMSIELMLNAVNLSFVAFSSFLDSADGQMFVFIVSDRRCSGSSRWTGNHRLYFPHAAAISMLTR